ncbi:wall-associated receptor kinase-like 14 [Olea europaea subsp. europaea]|uniref:Wall-associated receptor kinase-like 14 n=1 Tax=Olea europaea subsp. europaea TaxID=158383 RepID=A0A8S0V075_OLEEU|nr:wall-associated receptor kinase-like 14 [Olea europaea subsp. europaea]
MLMAFEHHSSPPTNTMISSQTFTWIVFLLVLSSAAEANMCNRSCGKVENRVPYPFGFSDGCGIKLNCSKNNGNIHIGDFLVQNLTSDRILVSLPGKCNRSIDALNPLFGKNFAVTGRNGLLLQNCNPPVNDFTIPRNMLHFFFKFDSCDFGDRNSSRGDYNHNISYYAEANDSYVEFLNYEKFRRRSNCRHLFSSIMVDWNQNGYNTGSNVTENLFISLKLQAQKVELQWWLLGPCLCDPNAICTTVNGTGFRCKCLKGYAGDGFARGKGCKIVSEHGGTRVGFLIGGIIAGASLVAAAAFICHCVQKRSVSLKSQLSARQLLSEAAGNSNVPLYHYKEIERATNVFSEKQRLGTGAFGTVYAGKLHSHEWVAIKRMRRQDHNSIEQVMNEIKLLSSLSHPNLVRLLGCCIENGEEILVYEYMPNGTLSQHLQRERGSVLSWNIRLNIAAETAHAIAHLHSAMNPPIYHRDIKSSNILLDFNFNAKVADFGLSRFGMTDDSHVSTAPQGTPGYVDPQYHQNFYLSDKSDVYSFGVVLVEIITAMKVVNFSRPQSEINLAALAIDRIGKGLIDEIIDPFLEPNRDAWTLSSIHKVAELAFRCLAFHRDIRPSMTEVADELEQIRISSWAQLDENVCTGSSVASTCSSLHNGSELIENATVKKAGVGSQRLIVPQKASVDLAIMEENESSPVSVQDTRLSEQSSSPSTNSLLGNVVQ